MFGLSNFIITEFLLIFYSLVTNVLYSYKVIERTKSKYLFKELGLVVEKDLSEFRFFEQSLLKFWVNLHRPITSW